MSREAGTAAAGRRWPRWFQHCPFVCTLAGGPPRSASPRLGRHQARIVPASESLWLRCPQLVASAGATMPLLPLTLPAAGSRNQRKSAPLALHATPVLPFECSPAPRRIPPTRSCRGAPRRTSAGWPPPSSRRGPASGVARLWASPASTQRRSRWPPLTRAFSAKRWARRPDWLRGLNARCAGSAGACVLLLRVSRCCEPRAAQPPRDRKACSRLLPAQ